MLTLTTQEMTQQPPGQQRISINQKVNWARRAGNPGHEWFHYTTQSPWGWGGAGREGESESEGEGESEGWLRWS